MKVPAIMSWVPADLYNEALEKNRLPHRPKARGEVWENAQRAALANPSDVRKWNTLFGILEQQCQQADSSADVIPVLKNAVSNSFTVFLSRFPFSAAHWKQFSILQFKLLGPKESIDCLEKAVQAYPQSVVLWGDYLAGLVATEAENHATKTENGNSEYTVEFIRGQFLRAESLIGYHFNSDPFWDKFIAFETSVAQRENTTTSSKLLALYLRLLRIPLYQYAQYYAQFGEFSKNFNAQEVIPASSMPEYLSRFEKKDASDLSIIESSQMVDLYAYDIFVQTQQAVTEKWQYESALGVQEFTFENTASDLEGVNSAWLDYLSYEIQNFDTLAGKVTLPVIKISNDNTATEESLIEASVSPVARKFQAVQNIFGRALVPYCMNEELWIKYIGFVAQSTENSDQEIRKLYEKAIFSFLPLKHNKIRREYGTYLSTVSSKDATDFWLKSIELYSGSHHFYAKDAYMQSIKDLLQAWPDDMDLLSLVESHFARVDRYKKRTSDKQGEAESTDVKQLSRYLNDDGIALVAVHYLRKNPQLARSFYNRFHTQQAFSRSVQFWRFFVEFEIAEKNLVNLKTIMDFIETSTQLPKQVIDCFLDMQYDATCSNLPQVYSSSEKEALSQILVLLSTKKSEDLVVNTAARHRLAANNYLESISRAADQSDALMKMRSTHLDHPGIFVESAPETTNSLLDQEWISLLEDDLKVPAMPTFKNLDKANAPINYPDE